MNRNSFIYLAALAPFACSTAAGAETMPETMLGWARKLVAEVAPENNFYGSHPTYVDWSDGGKPARNRSVCSSLANHLLEHSFGYTPQDIGTWFGNNVPQAVQYHAAVVARNGFKRIVHVDAIAPGDIIAIADPPGSHPTGHVMIAASAATLRTASAPIESGTQQYEIEVIDSANSGHGPEDTRKIPGGTWTTGVGHGLFRLYARADGTIAGHAWSTSSHSVFRPENERRLAVGRLDRARAPRPSGQPGSSVQTQDTEPSGDDGPTDS